MLGKNGLYFASRKKVARKVTVAVERVFTLYMMQDAVREMTIYMNTSIHTSFFIQLHASYMPVTCAKHCFKGLLLCLRAVSSRPVTCQLHELCPIRDVIMSVIALGVFFFYHLCFQGILYDSGSHRVVLVFNAQATSERLVVHLFV